MKTFKGGLISPFFYLCDDVMAITLKVNKKMSFSQLKRNILRLEKQTGQTVNTVILKRKEGW